ncbi:MAG: hypothetical protein WBM24_13400 [Candidatus Sulfotelmatobacter sp.]
MRHARKCSLFVVLALLVTMARAQYNWTPSLSLVDNTSWCTANNCLTSIGGDTVETKVGVDGTIYGMATTGLYTYTVAAGWVLTPTALQSPGDWSIHHISVGSKANVLALSVAPYPTPNVYVLNSAGTAWQPVGGGLWAYTAEIGPDGSIFAIGSQAGDLYEWSNGSWSLIGSSFGNVAVASANNVWAVKTDSLLYNWNGTVWSQAPSVPFVASPAPNTLAAEGETSVASIDTGYGIHVSADGANTWTTLSGTSAAVSGGGAMLFTHKVAGGSYHLNLVVPALTNTGGGFWACPPGTGCPPGSYHTSHATAYFGGRGGAHGAAGVTGTASGSPETNLTPVATEIGTNCDPFFGDPDQNEACQAYYEGGAQCSVMGALNGIGPLLISLQIEAALTQAFWSGAPPPACSPSKVCTYSVRNDCTAATTPPDLNMTAIVSGDYVGIATYITWINAALCIRTNAGGPWACATPLSFITSLNVPMPQYSCTHNP